MHAKGRNQVLVFATGYDHREMIVNALVQVVEHGKTICGSKMNFCLLNGVRLLFDIEIVHGHDEPL
jgi:hypothetical protein